MDIKEFIDQLDKLKGDLETTVNAKAKTEIESQIKSLEGKIQASKELSDKVVNAEGEIKKLNEWTVKKDEADKQNQEALDKIIANQQKNRGVLGGDTLKSFEAEVEEQLEKPENKKALADFKERGIKNKFSIDLQRKVVGNMGSATSLTGSYFVQPDVKPGIVLRPYEAVHMRDLLPTGTTQSNNVRHIRDNGGQGGPAITAEAGTKPQMDRALSIEDANVRKIATYLRIPEEMIDDIPYIVTFLSNIGTQEVMKVEDSQILYGDGTGSNVSGLFTNATAFAAGAAVIGASSNRFDVLRAARLQIRKLLRMPSFALISPFDYFMMSSVKDTTNNYILSGGGNGLIPNLDGVPIIENTNVADGDFLIMDRLAAEIDFRKTMQIRFFEQDQDNAIKNMVTVVIEERLALPIYYVNGLIKGTFAAGITDLTS